MSRQRQAHVLVVSLVLSFGIATSISACGVNSVTVTVTRANSATTPTTAQARTLTKPQFDRLAQQVVAIALLFPTQSAMTYDGYPSPVAAIASIARGRCGQASRASPCMARLAKSLLSGERVGSSRTLNLETSLLDALADGPCRRAVLGVQRDVEQAIRAERDLSSGLIARTVDAWGNVSRTFNDSLIGNYDNGVVVLGGGLASCDPSGTGRVPARTDPAFGASSTTAGSTPGGPSRITSAPTTTSEAAQGPDKPYLGVGLMDLPHACNLGWQLACYDNSNGMYGGAITAVDPNGPSAGTGIMAGDVLLAVDGDMIFQGIIASDGIPIGSTTKLVSEVKRLIARDADTKGDVTLTVIGWTNPSDVNNLTLSAPYKVTVNVYGGPAPQGEARTLQPTSLP